MMRSNIGVDANLNTDVIWNPADLQSNDTITYGDWVLNEGGVVTGSIGSEAANTNLLIGSVGGNISLNDIAFSNLNIGFDTDSKIHIMENNQSKTSWYNNISSKNIIASLLWSKKNV